MMTLTTSQPAFLSCSKADVTHAGYNFYVHETSRKWHYYKTFEYILNEKTEALIQKGGALKAKIEVLRVRVY